MRVLLTGFGPFPGVPRNPSQLIVERLSREKRFHNLELHSLVLPTTYDIAPRLLVNSIRTICPDVCISLGVGGNMSLRLERNARNLGTAPAPDQSGVVRMGVIKADGLPAYSSTLPLATIHAALLKKGVPVEFSDNAGGYVCNHVFYSAMYFINSLKLQSRCGFIHVPPAEESEVESAMSISAVTDAVEVIVLATVEHLEADATKGGV